MRATITPIPMSTPSQPPKPAPPPPPPVLPTLTDDMFVVEAPSFIVPYVYEKPPLKELKEFIKEVKKEIIEQQKKEEEEEKKDDSEEEGDEKSGDIEELLDSKKPYSYFSSPLGKFFVDIGHNLVQEYVQTDLLKQQKRKRDREGGQNSQTNKNIMSLIKNLEYTKGTNEAFKMEMKKCEFCSFKTESSLALAFHLETPHTKNFVYHCNFCTYEVSTN